MQILSVIIRLKQLIVNIVLKKIQTRVYLVALMGVVGCNVDEEERTIYPIAPDYISQMGTISDIFRDNYLLDDDDIRSEHELKVMEGLSRMHIRDGIMRDAISFRVIWSHFRSESAVSGWFLERGFQCQALTRAEQVLKRDMLPHVYRKNNVFIHVFERQITPIPTDMSRLQALGSFPVRIAVIRYDNVTQQFYPCHGTRHTIGQTYPIQKLE